MKYVVLVPEALVVAGAFGILLTARFMPRAFRAQRAQLPAFAAILALIAFFIELWVGGTLATYFAGGFLQDRFALFAKSAALLAAAVGIAVADWGEEDSLSIGLAMPLLAAFGVMVAASAADFVGVWAGLELAAAAGVVLVALRRPDVGLRLLLAGAVASALTLIGFAYLYAATGTASMEGIRAALIGAGPTLPLAIPTLLLLGGLAVRFGLAPFHLATADAGQASSPVGAAVVLGLVAAAAGVAAIKVVAALSPVPATFSFYMEVVAAIAVVGGGIASLAARSPRAVISYFAISQLGWVAAGLAAHYRGSLGAALFLLGSFVVAATAAPAALGRSNEGHSGLMGMGSLRPARAAGLALAILSLAGVPPLAGFFGEFAVAASLARTGHTVLLVLVLFGAVLTIAAAVRVIQHMYFQSPLDETRRAGAQPATLSRVSAVGALVACFVIGAYGLFGYPILALADQGAEALGLH